MSRIITLLRSVHGLSSLSVEICPGTSPLELPSIRLSQCPVTAGELFESWQAISSVQTFDSCTFNHVLRVIRTTLPAHPSRRIAPSDLLCGQTTEPAPHPSAAHPRAYRGTKFKPPKPKKTRTVDLIPYCFDAFGWAEMVRAFGPVARSYGFGSGRDPYLAAHHGALDNASLGEFSPHFVVDALGCLKGQKMPAVRTCAAAYRSLELDRFSDLRPAVTALTAELPEYATNHFYLALSLHHEYRTDFLTWAAFLQIDPNALTPEVLFNAVHGVDERNARRRLAVLLHGVRAGAAIDYLARGLAFESFGDGDSSTRVSLPVYAGATDPLLPVECAIENAGTGLDSEGGKGFWRSYLWRYCGRFEGFGQMLSNIQWSRLECSAVFALLRLITSTWVEDPRADANWELLKRYVPRTAEVAMSVERNYQSKTIQAITAAIYEYYEHPDSPRPDRMFPIVVRTARQPFAPALDAGDVLLWFNALPESLWNDALLAPDSSFLSLERHCRRKNDRWLIARGLRALVAHSPEIVANAWHRIPGKLLAAARLLGSLSMPDRIRCIQSSKEKLASIDTSMFDSLFRILDTPATRHLVPRSLRQSRERQLPISAPRMERFHHLLVLALPAAQLAWMEALAVETLSSVSIHECDATARHALQMLRHSDENQRAFRRFLRAHLEGDRDYIVNHPQTRQWLRRHPRLDCDAWLRGIGEVEDNEIVVSMETDPLEALKLGTYVGSCLGLGGGFMVSAVSVVLDLNKRVLYARDRGGRVVARQLLAVSESDQLVAYDVYPDTAQHLGRVFHSYVHKLAGVLGLSIHNPSEECDAEVCCILSHYFWDDGPVAVPPP